MHFTARSKLRNTCFLPVLVLTIASILLAAPAVARDIAEVQAELEARGAGWTASDKFIKTLTPEERAALRGGFKWTAEDEKEWERNLVWLEPAKDLPSYFDWRSTDGVTPVKSQGECGSCWAFAAAADVEAQIRIFYDLELDLSEQQLISCSNENSDCDGGFRGHAYDVMNTSAHGGIHEHGMPYQASSSTPCNQYGAPSFAHITGYRGIANNVTQIKTALLDGPVTTSVDAGGDGSGWDLYTSGCYDLPGGELTNHGVLIVGWDDRLCDGAGAWIIKNSWGTDFGISGYIYVQYGASLAGSFCTQSLYTPPATSINVTSPAMGDSLIADEVCEITWTTSGSPISYVNIFWSNDRYEFGSSFVQAVPNTGSYMWTVPNDGTQNGRLMITPGSGTRGGYGFSSELLVVGHKIRYVSVAGSNEAPYETVGTAAHSISDAVLACTGFDSVLVATDDYLELISINSPARIFGGWNASFTVMDQDLYPTEVRGVQSAVRIYSGATNYSGLFNLNFHDCQGGYYSSPQTGNHGGAVYCQGSSPTIRDCVFENCVASGTSGFGLGGAIMSQDGSPVIEDCEFIGGAATYGGAIMLLNPVNARLSGNVFAGNVCTDSTTVSRGGAIFIDGGVVSLDGDVFNGNGGVNRGGALSMRQAQLTAVDVTMNNNRSMNDGAAVFADTTVVNLSNSAFTGNAAAGSGGGMGSNAATLNLSNVLFSGNSSMSMGGGLLAMTTAGGSISNCLFRANSAPAMGAGAMLIVNGDLDFHNNMVLENTGSGLMINGAGVTIDYNNVWGNSAGDYAALVGANDISADPLFSDAASGDFGLVLHSPCVDGGLPLVMLDPDGSRADIGLLGGPGADTVAPVAVAGASVENLGGGSYRLSWDASGDADLDHYIVYCDTTEVFTPSVDNFVGSVTPPTVTMDVSPSEDCYYLVAAVDADGYVGGYSAPMVVEFSSAVGENAPPLYFALGRAVPNPFNPMTTMTFGVPSQRHVEVGVFDLRGRMVNRLLSGTLEAGSYDVTWNGTNRDGAAVAAGVYVVRMTGGGESTTQKVVLAK